MCDRTTSITTFTKTSLAVNVILSTCHRYCMYWLSILFYLHATDIVCIDCQYYCIYMPQIMYVLTVNYVILSTDYRYCMYWLSIMSFYLQITDNVCIDSIMSFYLQITDIVCIDCQGHFTYRLQIMYVLTVKVMDSLKKMAMRKEQNLWVTWQPVRSRLIH